MANYCDLEFLCLRQLKQHHGSESVQLLSNPDLQTRENVCEIEVQTQANYCKARSFETNLKNS